MSIKDKKGFQLYHDMGVVVDALTDQQAGQLLKAILAHVRMEYYEIEDPVVQIAFLPIRQTLERDHEKYLGIVDRNRANGSKGGRPRKNPVGYLGTQENPKEPKKADRDIGKDIDTDKEKKGTNVPKENAAPSSLSEGDFPDFWLPCLKKVARPAALQAWRRMRKEKRTNLSALELAERYNKAVEVSAVEKNGSKQFAPHPSTWINQDRWDDEVVEPPKKFPFTLPQSEEGYNGGIYPELHGQKFYVENWDEGRVFDESGNELVNICCIGDMAYGPRL